MCAYIRGGRSWLKFINFLLTNEAPCAFFPLTNGTDREVGGGCCLATAGRISDHVEPIVLSLLPERCYMLYVVRNIRVRVRHKVANSISVWLKLTPHSPASTFNWLPSCYYESTHTHKWSNGGSLTGRTGFFLVCLAVCLFFLSFPAPDWEVYHGSAASCGVGDEWKQTRPLKAKPERVDVPLGTGGTQPHKAQVRWFVSGGLWISICAKARKRGTSQLWTFHPLV